MKKIFIGSSSEALDTARKVQDILEGLGAETTCWADDDAFHLAHNTIDNLLQAAHEHSAGVFIFNPDDKIVNSRNRAEAAYIPRDNVIAEAGMFAGALGKESVVLCTLPGVHEISDFSGITNLRFDLGNLGRLKNQLRNWLEHDVREYTGGPLEKNVLMLPRRDIQDRFSIDGRLHISDGLYMKIRRIRIMNFASNLIVNPEIGERGHIPPKDLRLSDAIEKIMREAGPVVELMLTEPNPCNVEDLRTKIANIRAGSAAGALYSALATMYKNLSTDTIYRRQSSSIPVLFYFYVMKTSMPFGIFNVEFMDDAQQFSHVKVDLYSAALDNEDNRRSFIIWQKEDPENYKFFVDHFNNIKSNRQICDTPKLHEMAKWAEIWEKSRPGGEDEVKD